MEITQNTLEIFQSLFQGRTDVWGSEEGRCNRVEVTEKLYQLHLEGKQSLGIYPLLDDGNCHFAAIDLDEKDFHKAKAIRQELINNFIPAYIAESRHKGYHIYTFFITPVEARVLRRVLHHALERLGINAEVFPKQDRVTKEVPFGNYINLPCFGATRPFITVDLKTVPLDHALQRIKSATEENLVRALKLVPPEEKPLTPKKVKSSSGRKRIHPPCIESILRGVGQGARDEAAFALARHYLDQSYLPEEVLALVQKWDENNKPPFNDEHVLATKVRSAERGEYAFGCNSVMGKPMLKEHCIGEDKCDWLRSITIDRKKRGLIREASFYETDTHLYEEIVTNGAASFVSFNKTNSEINYLPTIDTPTFSIIPIYSAEITEGAVTLSSGIEEYGNTLDLVTSIQQHIHEFDDIPKFFIEFASWYIIMSWVYDKLSTVSYLRFMGDSGCGKSRSLDVIGRLCYKPMMLAGAVTPAPIYRIIRRFRGTLILDEADFKESSEKAEVVVILNCGFEKRRPVIRCSKDDPNNLEILPCFGPKVFASRQRFEDYALESRCLTHTMEETDRNDIPAILGETFFKREESLRNKLLLFRLRNYAKIDEKAVEDIDLGPIEPRLKQTSLPYAVPFKDMPDVLDRFRKFIQDYNQELIRERSESFNGKVLYALFKVANEQGIENVTAGAISIFMKDELKIEVTSQKVGRILSTLNLKSDKKWVANKQGRYVKWSDSLMHKLFRKYIIDPEEFGDLFKLSLVTPDMSF